MSLKRRIFLNVNEGVLMLYDALNRNQTYNDHVAKTTSNRLFKLIQISRMKHLLDRKSLILLMNAFGFSKLFYCSTVKANTSQGNVNSN